MIIQAYSLSQLEGVVSDVVNGMLYSGGKLWEHVVKQEVDASTISQLFSTEEGARIRRKGIITRDSIVNIPKDSKFGYYLSKSIQTGAISSLHNSEQPIAIGIQGARSWFLSHTWHINVRIYDISTIRDVAERGPSSVMQHLPPEIAAIYGQLPMRKDYEALIKVCHPTCNGAQQSK